MGNVSGSLGRILVFSFATIAFAVGVFGCDSNPARPPDPVIVVPEHTIRSHAGVSHPVITANGEKIIVNGNLLKTYSAENILLKEVEWALPESWAASSGSPKFHQDVDENLYLSLWGESPTIKELIAINNAGDVLWKVETSGYWEPEFPADGGVLYWYWTETERVLTKLDAQGNVEWRRIQQPGEDHVAYSIVEANRIYVLDGVNLIALELDGTEIWSTPVGDGETYFPWIGSSGNLTVVVSRNLIQAFDESGSEIWSVPVPLDYKSFREGLLFTEDKILINLQAQKGGGFLVLDGSGNQLNLFAGLIVGQMTAVDESRFIARDSAYPNDYLKLFDADTGDTLWYFTIPPIIRNSPKNKGDIVDEYSNGNPLSFAPNNKIYIVRNSTLIELNLTGGRTALFESSVITDEFVEAEWAIPWDIF